MNAAAVRFEVRGFVSVIVSVLVPATAIVSFAGVEKVLTVVDGKVVEKRVELGRRQGGDVEIIKGLEAGERVIVEPGNLVDGETVRVTQ